MSPGHQDNVTVDSDVLVLEFGTFVVKRRIFERSTPVKNRSNLGWDGCLVFWWGVVFGDGRGPVTDIRG